MVISVIPGRDLRPADVGAWSELQSAEPTLASPFFRPEFTEIVAAARRDVHVGVLPHGFFPFQRGRLGIGRPVGARLSDYHGLVAAPDADVDATELLRRCKLSTWEFDGLPAAQRAFWPFHSHDRVSPVVDLTDGYQAYAASRHAAGSSVLGEAARKADRLARSLGELRFEPHVADAGALARLASWKSAQYARTGAVDIFAYGWVRDVVHRLHATAGPDFAGLLSVLYAGAEPVAMHLGLRSASVWHWWLPAYDPAHGRYSPGTILLDFMARTATELGLHAIDFGKGDALYKTRFANDAIALAAGAVRSASPGAVLHAAESAITNALRRTPVGRTAQRASTRRQFR